MNLLEETWHEVSIDSSLPIAVNKFNVQLIDKARRVHSSAPACLHFRYSSLSNDAFWSERYRWSTAFCASAGHPPILKTLNLWWLSWELGMPLIFSQTHMNLMSLVTPVLYLEKYYQKFMKCSSAEAPSWALLSLWNLLAGCFTESLVPLFSMVYGWT